MAELNIRSTTALDYIFTIRRLSIRLLMDVLSKNAAIKSVTLQFLQPHLITNIA